MECGKLVDWAACVCATIDYPGPTATSVGRCYDFIAKLRY